MRQVIAITCYAIIAAIIVSSLLEGCVSNRCRDDGKPVYVNGVLNSCVYE